MSTPIDILETKKLSDDDFTVKTLDELKEDTDNVDNTYIPAVVKDVANYKVPVTEFGKGGSVAAMSAPAIIRDIYVPNTEEDPDLEYDPTHQVINFNPMYGSNYTLASKLTFFSPTNGQFHNIVRWDQDWEYSKVGHGGAENPIHHVDFTGVNKLVWYTWDKYYYTDSDKTFTEVNGKKSLNITCELLEENIVYEVEINICAFTNTERFTVHKGNTSEPSVDTGFRLHFYDHLDSDYTLIYPKMWAQDDAYLRDNTYYIDPNFSLFVQETNDTTHLPLYCADKTSSGASDRVLATAKVYFVKIKNTAITRGYDIYVMSY